MIKPRLTGEEIKTIIFLRKKGCTLSEIRKLVPKGKGTISKYIQGVIPYKKFQLTLEAKQNGFKSKQKSKIEWAYADKIVSEKIGMITERDFILMAGMLYWGEGNKKYELNIINSDPDLIRIFIKGLLALGVPIERIKISLRLYGDLDEEKAIEYWIGILNLNRTNLVSINYLHGKKEGKLPYGMCRLRIQRGGLYFKELISIMNLTKKLS